MIEQKADFIRFLLVSACDFFDYFGIDSEIVELYVNLLIIKVIIKNRSMYFNWPMMRLMWILILEI